MNSHFKNPTASPFCRRLAANHSEYKNWEVEKYTVQECEELEGEPLESLDDAEKALIQKFNPIDNVRR